MTSRTPWTTNFFFSLITLAAHAAVPPQPPASPYPPFQPIIQITSGSHSSASPTMSCLQSTTTTVHHSVEHTVLVKCPDIHLPTMSYMVDNITSASTTVRSWLWNNKLNIAAGITVYAYVATFYQLRQANHMLQQSDSWCTWKEITPLGHLAITSSSDLLQQLQHDIHKKYYRALDTQNAKAVHALFLQDTNKEMAQLDLYLSLYDFYTTIHMSNILPFKYSPELIHERKARLQFVVDLFIKWYLQQ